MKYYGTFVETQEVMLSSCFQTHHEGPDQQCLKKRILLSASDQILLGPVVVVVAKQVQGV